MKKVLLVLLVGSFAAANAVNVPVKFCALDEPFEEGQYFQFKMRVGTTCSMAPLSATISHCRVPDEDIVYATKNNTLSVHGQNVTALAKGKTEGVCFESPDGVGTQHFWRMKVY